ncbi:MAG: InlB B-repeat-containing protein, partial [Oscillospiraceae bacterium]|nr:InlB B-repeat-containing protein [Oscillospiraceae bacterium]
VNGGIGNLASQLKEHGIDLKLRSKVPTKASNIFLGWSTSANATVPEYQPSDMFLIDANTTLYAVWGIAPIIVQDVGNIHSGVTDLFVEALGFDLTYQWYTNTTNSNVGGIPIDDATEDTYALPSNDSTKFYYCEITSTDQSSSNTIKSNVAARPDIIAAFGSDIRFGSDYGIETEFGDIIYGLAPHSLYSTFEYDADTYIDTVGGATYIFDYDEYDQVVSTGAQIVVLDEFGVEIKRYTFIVFGDMNGDGTIDGTDLSILEDIVVDDLYNVHYYISGPTNILANPYYFAGDINANGKLDTGDYTYIHREAVSCEGYMTQVYEAPYFIDYNGWSGIVPNVPSTISFKDAGAYGPSFGKWICGLTERIRPTAMQPGGISQNISVIGDATVEVIPSSGNREGTGTKVIVRDGSGTIIDEYTVIVFGDINRDGNADGQDAVLLNYYLSGLNINLDMYQMAAADVDGDGDVDWDDYDALVQAGLFNYIVNQVR